MNRTASAPGFPQVDRLGETAPSDTGDTGEVRPVEGAGTDSELLADALAGVPAAWTELVRRHGSYLRRVALGYRIGSDAADDAVQTAWLRLLERGAGISDGARLRAWLATTVRRECLAAIRRRDRERLLHDADAWPELPADSADPLDTELLWAEAVRLLHEAMAELPPRNRQLLTLLSDSEESDYQTVSSRMAIPIGSIGPTRQRSLNRLQNRLAEQGIRECPQLCA